MRSLIFVSTAVAAAFSISAATAQTVGFGTTPPGSFTHSSGSAISKVISEFSDLKMRVQPGSGTAHKRVVAGQVQFGLSNSFDTLFFVQGKGEYEGDGPHNNLRLVAKITPLRVGIFVRKDSPIKALTDLKGKNLPSGFTAQKTIGRIITAHLANAGLTYDDVRKNPAPNVVRAADDFGTGKNDMLFFAVGSAKVRQVAAKVGGIRAVGIDTSAEAVARMRNVLPGSYPMLVKPGKRSPGFVAPSHVIAFDFLLSTAAEVSNDTVYKSVKALHGNKKKLAQSFRPLALFNPKAMAKNYPGLEYHPGAIKFYKEIGAWPPKG